MFAASLGSHFQAVQLLLEARADKARPVWDETTPIQMAAREGHVEVVQVLLEASVDKDQAWTDGSTLMFVASQQGHLEIVRLLLRAKPTRIGRTWRVQLRCSWPRRKVTRKSFSCCTRQMLARMRPAHAA